MSSSTTLTFEKLRKRNNEELEIHERALTAVPNQAEKHRRKIEKLLSSRAEIEDLASTEDQRAAYGLDS